MKTFCLGLIVLLLMVTAPNTNAQIIRPFTARYSNSSVRGKIVFVSNSIISSAGVSAGSPGTGEGYLGTTNNSSKAGINLDIDNAADVSKIAFLSKWDYFGNNAAPPNDGSGNTWKLPAYILTGSPWNNGASGTGNGKYGFNAAQATCIPNGGSDVCAPSAASSKYTAYYFRSTVNFTATELAAYTNIQLNMRRDDGIVVYVNGVEVLRNTMPAGAVNYATLASADIATGTTENLTANLSPSLFSTGVNTIAVEVHLRAATSADMSFDMEMLGQNNNGTFNATTSDLSIATACNKVLFAGLYWGAGQGASGSNIAWITGETTCKLKIPGASAYTTITSSQTDYHSAAIFAGLVHTGFKCFADITSIVNTSSPNGTYTVGNVASPAGINDAYGGWTIVFVYSNEALPTKNLTVFDGNAVIKSGAAPADVAISGFLTPPSGAVNCELGAVVFDGDRSSLDSFSFKQNGASGFYNLTPIVGMAKLNDMWNSTIGYLGSPVTTRNPSFLNTLGYDASIITLPNASNAQLGNSKTAATVRFASPSENYFVQLLTTSISQFSPSFSLQKTSLDVNGGPLVAGDIVRYTVDYSNLGNDTSLNSVISDQLPVNVGYVPGSIKINGVAKTDLLADDQAEYDIANRKLIFRIGTGANAVNGGKVLVNGSGSITFDVKVASSCTILSCSPVIMNSARIDYVGFTSAQNLADSSTFDAGGSCFTPGPVTNTLINPSCYTPSDTTLVNSCPSLSITLPWASYAGYTFYKAKPFIAANVFNPATPITASGSYWAYVNNGPGCSDTVRINVLHQNCPDLDEDNDGIPDYVESKIPFSLGDVDLDGVPNWIDTDYPGWVDNNIDGLNDNFDPGADSDNDGIVNFIDKDWPGYTDSNGDGVNDHFDTDLDGIPDYLDLDSDNDGIPDVVEAGGVDANGDGKIDNYTDPDNDGLSQNVDASTGVAGSGNGLAGTAIRDTDGDGVPDYIDLDSDNDGIPDVLEVGGADADNDGHLDNFTDSDADGFNDAADGDVGNDGIAENSANALLRTGADTNNDGRADSYPYKNMDGGAQPNPYDLDSDGDGITDVREAGFTDADSNGQADGSIGANGWSTAIDALPSITLLNSDGSGNPDFIDIDSDDDGIPDEVEGIATSSYIFPTYIDSDGDGIDDAYDSFAGFGGNGITPNDQDGDGIPDYRDTDTDGDGVADIIEGNDLNGNCKADDLVTLTGIDSDGDGLDDRFDADNAGPRATSGKMGLSGSTAGDPTPGSITTVQKCSSGTERDWRYQPYLLALNFLNVTGVLINQSVKLDWTVTCDRTIDHFDIERSTDGINFSKITEVAGVYGPSNTKSFTVMDHQVSSLSGAWYYRIRAIAKNTPGKLSAVVVIRSHPKNKITVTPNPATAYVVVTIKLAKASQAEIRILDASGKTVLSKQRLLSTGINSFRIDDIARFADGLYTIQIIDGQDVFNERIVIKK
ncbi:MAG: T9SS type A sorting domain-containing protein [Chitinophagaceae bacterium]